MPYFWPIPPSSAICDGPVFATCSKSSTYFLVSREGHAIGACRIKKADTLDGHPPFHCDALVIVEVSCGGQSESDHACRSIFPDLLSKITATNRSDRSCYWSWIWAKFWTFPVALRTTFLEPLLQSSLQLLYRYWRHFFHNLQHLILHIYAVQSMEKAMYDKY